MAKRLQPKSRQRIENQLRSLTEIQIRDIIIEENPQRIKEILNKPNLADNTAIAYRNNIKSALIRYNEQNSSNLTTQAIVRTIESENRTEVFAEISVLEAENRRLREENQRLLSENQRLRNNLSEVQLQAIDQQEQESEEERTESEENDRIERYLTRIENTNNQITLIGGNPYLDFEYENSSDLRNIYEIVEERLESFIEQRDNTLRELDEKLAIIESFGLNPMRTQEELDSMKISEIESLNSYYERMITRIENVEAVVQQLPAKLTQPRISRPSNLQPTTIVRNESILGRNTIVRYDIPKANLFELFDNSTFSDDYNQYNKIAVKVHFKDNEDNHEFSSYHEIDTNGLDWSVIQSEIELSIEIDEGKYRNCSSGFYTVYGFGGI